MTGATIEAIATSRIPVHVFVSYASQDRAIAEWVRDRLLDRGAASVWMDRQEIEGGDPWKREIDNGLRRTQVVVAVLTRTSVDPARVWIAYEQLEAQRLLRPVIPLLFVDEEELKRESLLPEHLRAINYIGFEPDREAGLRALLNGLGKIARRPGKAFQDQTPSVTHSFVGREEELRAAAALIDEDAGQIATGRQAVAIQGMGGLGKTMLAEELVRRLAPRYPGGITVERRGGKTREPASAVLQRWAQTALGEEPQRQYQPADIRSLLGGFGEMLVLIDDVDEEDLDNVRVLLESLPADATRLVTTRSANVTTLGCRLFPLERMTEQDALGLFWVRMAEKSGHPMHGNALEQFQQTLAPYESDLKRLVDRVDGHALALELAAGRCDLPVDIPEMVDELVSSLDEGVDELATDLAMSVSDKRHSVAASLSSSLRVLESRDQRDATTWASRFKTLGVFPGGSHLSAEMILAVWGDDKRGARAARQALSGLHKRSMISREVESGHYRHHPLLQAYAHGLLREDPEHYQRARQRYFEFIIDRAERGFRGSQKEWTALAIYAPHIRHVGLDLIETVGDRLGGLETLAQPDAEAPNAADHDRDDLTLGLAFAHAVREYMVKRPEWGAIGEQCLWLGLASARALRHASDQVLFLTALGRWYARRDPHRARGYFDRALSGAQRTGDRAQEGGILSYYGELERTISQPQRALEFLHRAVEIHRATGDRRMEAATLKYLGETYWRGSQLDLALEQYEEAGRIFEQVNRPSGVGDILNKIGSVNFNRGLHEKAIEHFTKALELHRTVGNRSMEAEDLNDMGISYKYLGKLDRALPLLQQALSIHIDLGNRRLQALTMSNIASIYHEQGRHDQVMALSEQAVAIAIEVDDLVTESWALNWLGLAHQNTRSPERALECFEKAEASGRRAVNPRGLAGTLGNLGWLLIDHLGRPTEGLETLEEAVRIMEEHKLAQAFGGRRLEEFRLKVALVRDEPPNT